MSLIQFIEGTTGALSSSEVPEIDLVRTFDPLIHPRQTPWRLNPANEDVCGSAHCYNGKCPRHSGGRHALSCLPYDVFDGDLGERRSNRCPSAVRASKRASSSKTQEVTE